MANYNLNTTTNDNSNPRFRGEVAVQLRWLDEEGEHRGCPVILTAYDRPGTSWRGVVRTWPRGRPPLSASKVERLVTRAVDRHQEELGL